MKIDNDPRRDSAAASSTKQLLVPVAVDAFIVGQRDREQGIWTTASARYGRLEDLRDPNPDPFETADVLGTGVHLHWALPDALTHGFQPDSTTRSDREDGGDIEFPYVPNRWAVVRMASSNDGPALRSLRAWLIESDSPDDSEGVSFPDPEGKETAINIGRVTEFGAEWQEAGKPVLFLRAVGPGNPSFAAFYPGVKNVFSFYDDTLPEEDQVLTYVVAGWYSRPGYDPLSQQSQDKKKESWNNFVASSKWVVVEEENKPAAAIKTPAQIICHGMICGVEWEGRDNSYPPRIPAMHTTVGGTAAEAIAAFVARSLTDGTDSGADQAARSKERLMEAFQYNMLGAMNDRSPDPKLTRFIHESCFAPYPGGSRWLVRRKATELEKVDDATPKLRAAEQALLLDLNKAQQRLDACERQLTSKQQQLYLLWWKKKRTDDEEKLPSLRDLIEKRKREFTELLKRAKAEAGKVGKNKSELENALKDANKPWYNELELVEEAMPRFWRATDPVLLIHGAGRKYKHGEDGRFSKDDRLLCRWLDQTISSMRIKPPGGSEAQAVTVTDSDLQLSIPAAGPAATAIARLVIESYLLDPWNAKAIANVARSKPGASADIDENLVKRLQTLPWNAALHNNIPQKVIKEQSGFNNTIPSRVGLELWDQGLVPLFIDWSIQWHPSYFIPSPAGQSGLKDLEDGLRNWRFEDYDYVMTAEAEKAEINYTGRSLLTPQVSLGFQTALRNLIDQPQFAETIKRDFARIFDPGQTGIPTIAQLLEKARYWDVLSQSLSGLDQRLIQLRPALLPPPHDVNDACIGLLLGRSIKELLALDVNSIEKCQAATPASAYIPIAATPATDDDEWGFFPVRAGHFEVDRLNLVTNYGYAINVKANSPDMYQAMNFQPDKSIEGGYNRYVCLPPRLSQPARLMFKMMSAADAPDDPAPKDTSLSPDVSPICGWLLPNRFDRQVAAFDRDGKSLGQLVTVRADPQWVRWDHTPGAGASLGDPPMIDNTYLRRFVMGLLQPGLDEGKALDNLLAAIDQMMWTVDPLGERGSEQLSLLVGQPLALVRAHLQLELYGDPVCDQRWGNDGKTHGWTDITFPVRLGDVKSYDDGLVGFWSDDDMEAGQTRYTKFRWVKRINPDIKSSYISPDNQIGLRPRSPDNGVLPPGKMVTLLLDPRGGAYAISGILPSKRLVLPAGLVDQAVGDMEVTFRVGPVLNEPSTIRMPLPKEVGGSWSWVHYTGVTTWQEDKEIQKTSDRARITNDPTRIEEGWLKLSGAVGSKKGG